MKIAQIAAVRATTEAARLNQAIRRPTANCLLHPRNAQLENHYPRELLRLARIEKYGPGNEKLSDEQLALLELEPGVSQAEVEAESERAQLKLSL